MLFRRGGQQQDSEINENKETVHTNRLAQGSNTSVAGPDDHVTDP